MKGANSANSNNAVKAGAPAYRGRIHSGFLKGREWRESRRGEGYPATDLEVRREAPADPLWRNDMTQAIQEIRPSAARDIPFNKLVLSQQNVRKIKAGDRAT